MARGASIYRAEVSLSLVERSIYEERTLTIARHPSETIERMLVRLLAYALRFDSDLEFGRGVSATDEPDLWSREGDGRVREWIEVGQPDGKRLTKAARQSERVTLFAFGEGVDRWRDNHLHGLKGLANLSAARINASFLAAVAAGTERQIRWALTLSEGIVYLTSGSASFETTPDVWLGDPLA